MCEQNVGPGLAPIERLWESHHKTILQLPQTVTNIAEADPGLASFGREQKERLSAGWHDAYGN